jgi:hypothetical protein
MGDNAAQAAAGQVEAHQLTTDERGHVQTAKNDSKSIALATISTPTSASARPLRVVVGDESARARIFVLSSPAHRACTRVDE